MGAPKAFRTIRSVPCQRLMVNIISSILMAEDEDEDEDLPPVEDDETLNIIIREDRGISILSAITDFHPASGPRTHAETKLLTLEDLCQFIPKDKFKIHFRFKYEQFESLKEALQIPDLVQFNNGCTLSGYEAMAIFLKRLASHAQNEDLSIIFRRPASTVAALCVFMAKKIASHLTNLQSLNHRWLSYVNLDEWAKKISDKEITLKSGRVIKMPLESVGGFVDGKCQFSPFLKGSFSV